MSAYTGPVQNGFVITPNDTQDIAIYPRGLYCGTGGDIKVDLVGGSAGIVLKALAAGIVHPIRVKRVYATGTTAADILGLY